MELPPGPSCYLVRLFYVGPVVELPPGPSCYLVCLFYVGPVVELPPGPSYFLLCLFYVGPVVELPPGPSCFLSFVVLCWTCGGTAPRSMVATLVSHYATHYHATLSFIPYSNNEISWEVSEPELACTCLDF